MVIKEPCIAENKEIAVFQRVCVFCRRRVAAPSGVISQLMMLNGKAAAATMSRLDSIFYFKK
jgi:hypothetical protein